MNELYLRNDATVTEVRWKDRIIEAIAVPWEQAASVVVRGQAWREIFQRGAFDSAPKDAGRIRVNREHRKGHTVGKVVELDPKHSGGLFTRIRIARTALGDETLALAAEDMISLSVGYFVRSKNDIALDAQAMIRRVKRAFLDHIGLVEDPAYAGAQVVGIRSALPLATPDLDQVRDDPIFEWADSRVRGRARWR